MRAIGSVLISFFASLAEFSRRALRFEALLDWDEDQQILTPKFAKTAAKVAKESDGVVYN